jgi:CMP-N-acetylneuraminic acid synthetase
MKRKIIALLPLKDNSQRIKGKNFKSMAGKPLFSWILETLLQIESIDFVLINTDARKTLEDNGLSDSDRVVIKDRPNEIRGDDVSMNLIIENDISTHDADLYLMTHTTNPLLSADTIKLAIELFESSSNIDSLFSVNKIQTRFYDEQANPINHDPNNLIQTQDLPVWYEENSCLYIFTKKSFEATSSRIGSSPMIFPIPKTESVDIDEIDDWNLAEAMQLIKKNS